MYQNKEKELQSCIAELEATIKKLKSRKRYGLVWEEKPEEVVKSCKEKLPVLAENQTKEIKTDKEKPVNILIESDNYHALSVLNYTHKEKIDVIYIDPPYNRGIEGGNDFRYNDKFIDSEDPFKHSKWVSFIEKRLRLAKNLLRSTGVIFISIDDVEQPSLRLVCNEVFGEKNFIGSLIWRKKEGGGQADTYFVTEHEYVLVYAKSNQFVWRDEEILVEEAEFNKLDERGKFTAVKLAKWGNTAHREDRPKMYFPIEAPNSKNIYPIAPDGADGRWRVGKKRMEMLIENNLLFWQQKDNNWIPYEKIYYEEGQSKKVKERSILYNLATTADGTNELKEIFGKKDVFENPKPTELIKFFLQYGADNNAIVLDFFAGSGTTGHAVLDLNKEDDGTRHFILCTNNENKIAEEVCYPRIKKVIEGYKNLKGEKVVGLGGNLKYYKTDFVGAEPTDKNKKQLVDKSTEMLCLKEDCFENVRIGKNFNVFRNNADKYLGIIYDDNGIADFKKEVRKLNKNFIVYIFSLDDSAREEEFEDMKDLVELKPIPAVILNVYKQIFK